MELNIYVYQKTWAKTFMAILFQDLERFKTWKLLRYPWAAECINKCLCSIPVFVVTAMKMDELPLLISVGESHKHIEDNCPIQKYMYCVVDLQGQNGHS